jgi:ubiquinone/menaquinone biosynthesis C-methylase UbiE
VNSHESKYVEKKGYHSRYTHERMPALRDASGRLKGQPADPEEWMRTLKDELPRFVPFLTRKCGVEFSGRILEIGAGGAWLSAELSKLPKVVEIITTDLSPKLLKEEAPQVFRLLGAHTAKITRMPADFHALQFPDNHFDFVVCSAVLQHAANIVQVLREAKRVLKPGGRFIAIREPVWPLVKLKSRASMIEKLVATGVNERFHSLSHFREFFKQAALPLEVRRVALSSGLKYYLDQAVNGITHARYAFIGTKPGPSLKLRSRGAATGPKRP